MLGLEFWVKQFIASVTSLSVSEEVLGGAEGFVSVATSGKVSIVEKATTGPCLGTVTVVVATSCSEVDF